MSFREAGKGIHCFITNLCNFDELATTILLYVDIEPLRLDFQRLAKELRIAWKKEKGTVVNIIDKRANF